MCAVEYAQRARDWYVPDLAEPSSRTDATTGGAEDVGMLIKLFEAFFEHYSEADKALVMDE